MKSGSACSVHNIILSQCKLSVSCGSNSLLSSALSVIALISSCWPAVVLVSLEVDKNGTTVKNSVAVES